MSKKEYMREYMKVYNKTEKGKAYIKKYTDTDKHRKYMKDYMFNRRRGAYTPSSTIEYKDIILYF